MKQVAVRKIDREIFYLKKIVKLDKLVFQEKPTKPLSDTNIFSRYQFMEVIIFRNPFNQDIKP